MREGCTYNGRRIRKYNSYAIKAANVVMLFKIFDDCNGIFLLNIFSESIAEVSLLSSVTQQFFQRCM